MARILFVVTSDPGHINPLVGPAWYLQEEGHEVGFFSPKDLSSQLSRADLTCSYFLDDIHPIRLDAVRSLRLAENLRNREWAKLWLRSVMIEALQERVDKLEEVTAEFAPDVIVLAATAYEGAIVAQRNNIPWVAVTGSLNPFVPDLLAADLHEMCKHWAHERHRFFASNGAEATFRLTEVISPHLNVAMTTNELIGHRGNPEYKRVGPSISPRDRGDETDFPWEKVRDNVPLIYMSLGADTYNQPEAINRVIQAVEGQKVQLVVYAGNMADDESSAFSTPPSNVLLCSYVPQLTVLAGSSAFITHGGATSIMEAVHYGVPMLVSPLWNDHPHQAFFIDKEGGGIRCDIAKTPPNMVWKHLETLMYGKKFKESTERLQLSYKRNEGATEMARLIDQVASRAKV